MIVINFITLPLSVLLTISTIMIIIFAYFFNDDRSDKK